MLILIVLKLLTDLKNKNLNLYTNLININKIKLLFFTRKIG